MKIKTLPLVLLIVFAAAFAAAASEAPKISVDELNSRLGEAGLAIVDVRITGDWNKSDKMIAGAIRGNPNDMGMWRSKLGKDQMIVLYCS